MKVKSYRYYLYYFLKIGAFFMALFPRELTYLVSKACGRAVFFFLPKFSKVTVENLKNIFPDRDKKQIVEMSRNVFGNLAANFAEMIYLPRINKEKINRIVTAHGMRHYDEVLKKGNGAILLTAHFGGWEILGAYMCLNGYYGSMVVKRIYFHKYNKVLNNLRRSYKPGIIYRDESPKKMMRVLRDNLVLALLADQDIDSVHGIFVDFFGKPTYTPVGPIKFAAISGAPIIPTFMVRSGFNYELFVDEPIYVTRMDTEEQTLKYYTQKWTKVLESYIMKYPEQWVWMHKRWKTKPNDKITAEI